MGVVDVYDAVTTRRPYQGPHTAQEAIDILRGQVARGWRRADLVDTFADARRERPTSRRSRGEPFRQVSLCRSPCHPRASPRTMAFRTATPGGAVIGSQISHYRILSKIGKGGMGEVYLAEDLQLDRKVALKFLPEGQVPDETARRRLLREANAAARLDHPFITKVYEVGQGDDRRRRSLHRHGARRGRDAQGAPRPGPMPLADALRIAVRDRRSARVRPPARHRPSRPEAGQRDADGRRPRQGHGLRHRQVRLHSVGGRQHAPMARA